MKHHLVLRDGPLQGALLGIVFLCGAACAGSGTATASQSTGPVVAPSGTSAVRPCGGPRCPAASPRAEGAGEDYAPFSLVPKMDYATGLLGDIPVPALFQLATPQGVVGADTEPSQDVPAPCKAVPKAVADTATSLGCFPSKHGGVWLVHVRATRTQAAERGVWKVGFVRGWRVTWGPARPYERLSNGYSIAAPPAAAMVGDWDGDGAEDVALWTYEGVNSADVGERSFTAYTLVQGTLKPLPFFREYAGLALRDCDGDQKPEIYYDPYRSFGTEQSLSFLFYNRRVSPAWSLMAELTPQGPAVDGTLARAYAAQLCSDVTEAPLAEHRPGGWPHVIHCRKLRGVAAPMLEAELARACANATGDLGTFCRLNRDPLLHMARASLPLTLAPSDAAAPPECALPPVAQD